MASAKTLAVSATFTAGEPDATAAAKVRIAATPASAKSAPIGVAADEGSAPIQPSAEEGDRAPARAAAPRQTAPAASTPAAAKPLLDLAADAGAKLVRAQAAPAAHAKAEPVAHPSDPAASPPAATAAASTATDATLSAPDAAALHAEAGLDRLLPDQSAAGGSPDGDPSTGDQGNGSGDASADATFGLGVVAPASVAAPSDTAGAPSAPPTATVSVAAADLAAQMAAKASASGSRFTLQLNPHGLGRVDVTVAIGPDRQLTAALAFADPHAANAMSAHAGELKSALEQAGFTVPHGGFDFTSSASPSATPAPQAQAGGFGLGSGAGGGFADPGQGFAGSGGRSPGFAFGDADPLAAGEAASAYTASGDSRLDIRI